MPYYRLTGGSRTQQFFPGENGWGHDGLSSGSSISPMVIPSNWYAEPDRYGFPAAPSPWTYTEERRAALALYDVRRDRLTSGPLGPFSAEVDVTAVYVIPPTWRHVQLFGHEVAAVGTQEIFPSAIASAEAFGTPSLAQHINPVAIASAERFAAPLLPATVELGATAVAATLVETQSFAIVIGKTYLLIFTGSETGANGDLEDGPATVSGGGQIEWHPSSTTPMARVAHDSIATPKRIVYAFRGTPTVSGNVTAHWTWFNPQECSVWLVIELDGVEIGSLDNVEFGVNEPSARSIVQVATNRTDSATALNVTLAAFADDEHSTFFVLAEADDQTTTAEAPLLDVLNGEILINGATQPEQAALWTGYLQGQELTPGATVDVAVALAAVAFELRARVARVQLTVNPPSIGSGEAFGSASLAQHINPTGIPSAEAFGSPSIAQTLNPSAIASAEVVSTPALDQTINPNGIASAEAFGTPSVEIQGGTQFLDPSGIASGQAFGTPALDQTLNPSGIASGEAFGSPTIEFAGAAVIVIPLPTWTEAPPSVRDTNAPEQIRETDAPVGVGETTAPVRISHTKAVLP